MKLSVLINNYNYAQYLRECIDSVLAQDHGDTEVIVVDDGSTDDSRAVIESYGTAIRPLFKENGGQASSFNAGFAMATGEVVLMLDADDAFLPGKLSTIDRLYAEHGVDWCFDMVEMTHGVEHPEPVRTRAVDARATMAAGSFPDVPVPTSGLTFRHALLGQILPMPLARDVVLSDNYLKFAAAFLGRGLVVETPLTYQRIHQGNRYTANARARELKPRIMKATGLALAQRYPGLGAVGKQLATGGIAESGTPLVQGIREVLALRSEAAMGNAGTLELLGLFAKKRAAHRARALLGR